MKKKSNLFSEQTCTLNIREPLYIPCGISVEFEANFEWPGVGKGPWTVKDGSIPIPVRRAKDFREEKRRMGYLVNKQSYFNTYIDDNSDRLILSNSYDLKYLT